MYLRRPELGEKFGVIEIPVLKRRLPIYEGAEPAQLDLGVGHVASSVLPGENDNSVLAGHRGTSFRNFGLISLGDLIIITTQSGSFTYQTNEIRIVEIDDETVIVSTRSSILTLITCYPFNWIGPAPQRYIVTAVLIESVLNP